LDDFVSVRPQFWVNSADNGGAIYAANSPLVLCEGAEFGADGNGNTATSGSGGAIYMSGSYLASSNVTS
jgi:hypothetical protein